jgi:hypothetical protein
VPSEQIIYRTLSGSNYHVYMAERREGTWLAPLQISTSTISSSIDPRPVITRHGNETEDSPLYRIHTGEDVYNRMTASNTVAMRYGRRVELVRPSSGGQGEGASSISVQLSGMTLTLGDGTVQEVELAPIPSSLDPSTSAVWGALWSRPFQLSVAVDSVLIECRVQAVGPQGLVATGQRNLRLGFDLVDGETNQLIMHLGTDRPITQDTVKRIRVRQHLTGLGGRTVVIRPVMRGVVTSQKGLIQTLVHVHMLEMSPELGKSVAGTPPEHHGTPGAFALHPNYPNPFNPITTFTFDIPYSSFVILKVYDVLGREVATLVHRTHEAGYHSVTWDASNVASGVYFARFTATNAAGALRLSKVSKFVLTK